MAVKQASSPRVAIYCRVSSDRVGEELGVTRQEQLCKARVKKNKWLLVDTYKDNNVSASKKKSRPEYFRLLADLTSGRINTIVVYAMDRLYRKPRELEDLLEIVDTSPNQIKVETLTGSTLDLNSADGIANIRILVTLAKRETDMMTKRIQDKHQELAIAGKPHGGERAFGYENDQITINKEEAKIIKEMVKIFLATQSTGAVVRHLNSKKIKTSRGGTWGRRGATKILSNPRYAGYRFHKGELHKAIWKPIIDDETHKLLVSILSDPSRRTTPDNKRRYLLTGLCICGGCGSKMSNMTRGKKLETSNTYACRSDQAIKATGCGHVRMLGRYVDSFVIESVMTRLKADKKLLKSLSTSGDTDFRRSHVEALKEVENWKVKINEVQDMWTQNIVSKDSFITMKKNLDIKLNQATKELMEIEAVAPAQVLLKGEDFQTAWEKRNIEEKRALLRVLISEIKISPASNPGSNKADFSRIEIIWRQ